MTSPVCRQTNAYEEFGTVSSGPLLSCGIYRTALAPQLLISWITFYVRLLPATPCSKSSIILGWHVLLFRLLVSLKSVQPPLLLLLPNCPLVLILVSVILIAFSLLPRLLPLFLSFDSFSSASYVSSLSSSTPEPVFNATLLLPPPLYLPILSLLLPNLR